MNERATAFAAVGQRDAALQTVWHPHGPSALYVLSYPDVRVDPGREVLLTGGFAVDQPLAPSTPTHSSPGTLLSETGSLLVTGPGADIWGTADAFHSLHQPIRGDFQVVVRAATVEHVDRWTTGG